MEWHWLDEMLDYHARCEAKLGFDASGECKCECWMFERDEDGWHTCSICGNRISDEEFDDHFPIPY